jgi:3' terminal RNA ribose 2'-O-methyltransferase Hen1
MLLTITTTHQPATDLGYLLHKNPARAQTFDLTFRRAHVFYPEATAERCTAALLLDIDPVGLARGRRGSVGLEHYVNDRPYVGSSFLSVAIAEVFGTALNGRSKDRPELAETPIPLVATLSALPSRGGEPVLRSLFEPLGYTVVAQQQPLDECFPEWGPSRNFAVELRGEACLCELLSHLYVLVPALDAAKHYYIGDEEVEKLLKHGAGWLAAHPARELITARYLKRRGDLVREALARLVDETPDEVAEDDEPVAPAAPPEQRQRLQTQRIAAVVAALQSSGARLVLDLGCGEGQLLRALLADPRFEQIVGLDVSHRALATAAERLRLDRLPERQRARLTLLHGSLVYRDERLRGYDAAAVVEVVEHLDRARLAAFERVLFEHARPTTIVLTTPNAEYNVLWETLPAEQLRHADHRFEWTRAEFQAWSTAVAERYGYSVRFMPVGPEHAELGSPTQLVVFTRAAPSNV